MAEFTEVMKHRERMCDSCVVKGENCVSCLGHLQNIREHPKESELFILKWANENPIKTNADILEEFCKKIFGLTFEETSLIEGFWDREYKEPNEVE